MPFIIRLRTSKGVKRLLFNNPDSASYNDLLLQTEDLTSIPKDQLLISKTPIHNPSYIELSSTGITLSQLGFKHGDMLYLKEESLNNNNTNKKERINPFKKKKHKLTIRCQHGPNGRCMHCDGAQKGITVKPKCTHGKWEVCINCPTFDQTKNNDIADFWCNHPDTVFCPKCAPPIDEDLTKKIKNHYIYHIKHI